MKPLKPLKPEKLKTGKLYKLIHTKICWPGEEGVKWLEKGDILLYVKYSFLRTRVQTCAQYGVIFIDKDGQEIWMEDFELEFLEEMDET